MRISGQISPGNGSPHAGVGHAPGGGGKRVPPPQQRTLTKRLPVCFTHHQADHTEPPQLTNRHWAWTARWRRRRPTCRRWTSLSSSGSRGDRSLAQQRWWRFSSFRGGAWQGLSGGSRPRQLHSVPPVAPRSRNSRCQPQQPCASRSLGRGAAGGGQSIRARCCRHTQSPVQGPPSITATADLARQTRRPPACTGRRS